MIRDGVRRQLPELLLDEEEREKRKQIAFLQKHIAKKRVKLSAGDMLLLELANGPYSVKNLRTLFPTDAFSIPLDALLD